MCPTCFHTMQLLATTVRDPFRVYWCPRCGTVRQTASGKEVVCESPMLVDRCRQFARNDTEAGSIAEFRRLGITESINLPENRENLNTR
jgi:hypothetical protein